MPAEQATLYQEERAKRSASRKQLIVRNLVARLDHELVLSAEQRDQLSESLSSHWDDAWGQSLEMFMYDYAVLPPIPDQYIAPYLSEAQKRIWRDRLPPQWRIKPSTEIPEEFSFRRFLADCAARRGERSFSRG